MAAFPSIAAALKEPQSFIDWLLDKAERTGDWLVFECSTGRCPLAQFLADAVRGRFQVGVDGAYSIVTVGGSRYVTTPEGREFAVDVTAEQYVEESWVLTFVGYFDQHIAYYEDDDGPVEGGVETTIAAPCRVADTMDVLMAMVSDVGGMRDWFAPAQLARAAVLLGGDPVAPLIDGGRL